jgi:segregation and condensation protein B
MREDINQLVEALIFASPEPVSSRRLTEVIGEESEDSVIKAVRDLNEIYEKGGRSFHIVRGAGGYRFATRQAFGNWVRRLLSHQGRVRLSRAALETLSLIAYRQPISRSEIEGLRRVDADSVLRMLLEKRLVRIAGRGKSAGRPLLYGTTVEFLKHFGIESLNDLPQSSELAVGRPKEGLEGDLFEKEGEIDPNMK